MMTLAAFMKRKFGVSVAIPLLISHHMKITDVSNYIRKANGKVVPELAFQVDLMKEFSLLDAQLQFAQQNHLGVIFLTGATGFLGTQILRQLLNHAGVDKVIVHVRASDSEHGKQKIVSSAKAALWWLDDMSSKLEIWAGDLSQPMLGLNCQQWLHLRMVDAIIHNGASVNWTADYDTLTTTNVNSTFEILKAMSGVGPRPKLVYISGGRSFGESQDDKSTATKLAAVDGYSRTKFVSELLLKHFAQRAVNSKHPRHISIVKPGLIIGNAREGVANTGDFLWRHVAGAMRLGAYPKPEKDDWLVVSSVDIISQAVIDALLRGYNASACNINIADGVLMTEFWGIVD
ncbi:hypothetical protein G7Y89_g2902 [Cudoniella acicularis]|uniref:Thioester reductase (TE) domain-containing protein n=1 Tax=Cudoniella acicularis TaxID=354080 RepID=A0A8H4RSH3_9HELO|nr:hypothetical protein G7Y89_g2902 [Cudoniella acicularis]